MLFYMSHTLTLCCSAMWLTKFPGFSIRPWTSSHWKHKYRRCRQISIFFSTDYTLGKPPKESEVISKYRQDTARPTLLTRLSLCWIKTQPPAASLCGQASRETQVLRISWDVSAGTILLGKTEIKGCEEDYREVWLAEWSITDTWKEVSLR